MRGYRGHQVDDRSRDAGSMSVANGSNRTRGSTRTRIRARDGVDALGVRLLGVGDADWDRVLTAVPRSVFHTAAYHGYSRGFGEGEPYLAVIGDERRGFAWPYLLRPIRGIPGVRPTHATDVHSVYGYPGPVAWGCSPGDPFVRDALALLAETWRAQDAVSVFTRFNPLLSNAAFLTAAAPASRVSWRDGVLASGQTVSVDLTLDDAVVRKAYGRDLGRQVNVGRREGLVTVHDTDWTYLQAFADLYAGTMTRIGAASFYFFTADDFERLHRLLGDHAQLLVTLHGRTVAAAGLFLELDGVVEWHLVGSNDKYRDLSPSKVLVDHAIRWARDRGNRVLHMGGGRGGREDSLFWFKSRFSPRRHEFATGRWVLEPARYEAMVRARRRALPRGARVDEGYFPAYRAPLLPDSAS